MSKPLHPIFRFLIRFLLILLVTLLLFAAFLYGAMALLCKGPSPTARELFVLSTRETSAIGFLPRLYMSQEEIDEIVQRQSAQDLESTDPSLISVRREPEKSAEPDAWGYVDEDGDGLIHVPVAGESFIGHMLIVLDPSRVIMGCIPESFHQRGYTLEELVKHFDAVAGINGGGFEDPGGLGDGSTPERTIVFKGKIYLRGQGTGYGFAGLDRESILHVGVVGADKLEELGIQYGTGYGPVLISNY